MANCATHMGDPHGDPQTSPQHADPHGLGPFQREPYRKSMWIGVLWAGLWVAMWITHVGGQILLWPEESLSQVGNPFVPNGKPIKRFSDNRT